MQGSPLEQFAIYKVTLLGYSISPLFTNFLFFAVIAVSFAVILFAYGSLNYKIVPDRWGGFVENYYLYIYNLLKENAGARAQIFLPFLSTVFFFILISNLLGMFPFGYALTSQILITFLFSCSIFLGTIFLGLRRHGINFFSLFFPSGSPAYMAFLLVPIELLSFIARPFSLGIRLFANMLAGHVLLKILSTFILVGVFAVQGLDVSAISLVFKESWIAEKFGSTQLNNSGNTYVGVDHPGLLELTRVYKQPIVFDFSDAIDKVSLLDEKIKISKNLPEALEEPTAIYENHLEQISQPKKEIFPDGPIDSEEFQKILGEIWAVVSKVKIFSSDQIDSPEFLECLKELWEVGPRMPGDPVFPEAFFKPSAETPPETPLEMEISANPKHFPFIYGLPQSNQDVLFSFNITFLFLFNFLISPILLVAKAGAILAQIALLLAFVMLELGIALLQAYVFIILTIIYINDSLSLH